MNTSQLKKFAQAARRQLMEQVAARLDLVLNTDSAELRGQEPAIERLRSEVAQSSRDIIVERAAYTWFNRFCALRFMDINHFTSIGVVSPEGDFTQPEILQEAKQGYIDEELQVDSQRVFDLLGGRISTADPQQEAYRLLLIAECNRLYRTMPFMFQHIKDYTELLMVDDLLSEKSILAAIREALTEENCQDVEVIGWLYQFYISEKKDQVFEGLKKNKKITPENIPAATQLFTPHWIVRYLLENSLGRLWMLNKPNSSLVEHMDYYIKPEEPETDYLKVNSPEELKICDPACGSGHMLTYAFDLLYQIYAEEGYDSKEIPGLILNNNLHGIEIDKRAGDLAAFALTMKARGKFRRFFRKMVHPNICVLQNVTFEDGEIQTYIEAVGRDLFTNNLQTLLHQFEEAENFGSLIRPAVQAIGHVRSVIKEKRIGEQITFAQIHPKVIRVLEQAKYLTSQYHVVVANPPYMGSGGMNGRLKNWVKENYSSSKADLFASFIERNIKLAKPNGTVAMITMQGWMFLSSYEALRTMMLKQNTLLSMAHFGSRAFDSIGGEVVSTTAFILANGYNPHYKGVFLRLVSGASETEKKSSMIKATNNLECDYVFRRKALDFDNVPGRPIAYWLKGVQLFKEKKIGEMFISGGRNKTHNNEKYLRYFWEIQQSDQHWVCYANGGDYRKYAGNELQVINWSENARDFYNSHGGLCNKKFWNKEGITWSLITSTSYSFRIKTKYSQYSSGSPTIFNSSYKCDNKVLAFLNSPIANYSSFGLVKKRQ